MLGEMIRKERRRQGKTQEALAQCLGVQRSVISKYETGAITPSLNQTIKIAETLSIPLSDLLGIEPEENKESDRQLLVRLLHEYSKEHGDESVEYFKSLIYFDENGLRFRDGGSFDRLVSLFDSLNSKGQEKAVERVEELTEIPKYRKETPPQG